MKEEDAILRKVGTGNPFRVPDAYFEGLTSKVMENLPQKEKSNIAQHEPTLWEKVKPWVYMAAMFAGAALIIRVASSGNVSATDGMLMDETEDVQYISTVVDNSMLDDYELYVYLSEYEGE